MQTILTFIWFLITTIVVWSQIIIPDFQVNNGNQNSKGVWRTAIAARANSTFAVAWQDYNDYNNPIAEQPRVAVQIFNSDGSPIGSMNLFKGESRDLSIWTTDYLTENIDIEFTPNGTLLLAVEHQGDFSLGGDFIFSSETGVGAVSANGEIIDISNSNGVILWLISTELRNQYHPRLTVAPDGQFFVTLDGDTFETGFNAVAVRQLDANGNFVGDFFTPHTNDPGPQSNHGYPDIATNGVLHMIVWQDGRQDANYDISAQFYNNSGPVGSNIKVNQDDQNGTLNLLPSVCMNSNGSSVVVWVDTRNNPKGEIYGQLFNTDNQPAGTNFQISAGEGEIWDRPEVAMLDDGSFFVVWTDSANVVGIEALRAKGRQFDADGNPQTLPFIIPDQGVASGLVTVASDGQNYYLAWIDTRFNNSPNVYSKVITKLSTDVESSSLDKPSTFYLGQNYPNPFNPTTNFEFRISNFGFVSLKVYDALGREVTTLVNEEMLPGVYEVTFDARNLASGVYLYRIQVYPAEGGAGSFNQVKRMVLLK
jgi:hypothetical protein